jgi:hypothetical protein
MEQSPSWGANWFAASQEIPRVLLNPKVPHHTHKRPPRIPILSQPNPVLTPTSHFLQIHPNIILPSMPGSPQRSLSPRLPHQNPVHTSPFPHTCYMLRPSQSSRWWVHLTYLLTPWSRVLLEKLTGFAASQEIPRALWNPKVPHRTHKRPPPIPILSQPNSVLTPTSHFLKIHSNIIPPSTPGPGGTINLATMCHVLTVISASTSSALKWPDELSNY